MALRCGDRKVCLADWLRQALDTTRVREGATVVRLVSTASLELPQRGVDLDWTGVVDGTASL